MFLKADKDGSGTIDFEEFKRFMEETKTMFLKQMDSYICFQTILIFVNMTI